MCASGEVAVAAKRVLSDRAKRVLSHRESCLIQGLTRYPHACVHRNGHQYDITIQLNIEITPEPLIAMQSHLQAHGGHA